MIKCNVTVCGTISKAAVVRISKDGNAFTTFVLSVAIPVKDKTGKILEVSVIHNGESTSEVIHLTVGSRVEVTGLLTFRKRGEVLYLNLNASSVNPDSSEKGDQINGILSFRGTVGKIIELKKDKKGNDYLAFSAFSTEKVGEEFAFTWVRFIRFSSEREKWLQQKSDIEAKGELEISVYHDKVNIGCKLTELSPWEKKSYIPNN